MGFFGSVLDVLKGCIKRSPQEQISAGMSIPFSWTGDTEFMLITILRSNKTSDGAFSTLTIDVSSFKSVALEKLSTLIPVGIYNVLFMWSEHFQQIMPHIIVPNRTAIEIHWANYPVQLDGCLAIGTGEDFANDMITESKNAWIGFVKAITDQPAIKIKYVEDYGS